MEPFCSVLNQRKESRLLCIKSRRFHLNPLQKTQMKFTITNTLAFLIISSTIARPTQAPSDPAPVAAIGKLPVNGLEAAPIDSKAADVANADEMKATAADSVVPSTDGSEENKEGVLASEAPTMEDALDSPKPDKATSSVELPPSIEDTKEGVLASDSTDTLPMEDALGSVDGVNHPVKKDAVAKANTTTTDEVVKPADKKASSGMSALTYLFGIAGIAGLGFLFYRHRQAKASYASV
jgi:hypothetical protein